MKKKAAKTPRDQRLAYLLPDKDLDRIHQNDEPPQSLYPVLRLLLPEVDHARVYKAKEAHLAKMYIAHYIGSDNKNENTTAAQQLLQFKNESIVAMDKGCGDLPNTIFH